MGPDTPATSTAAYWKLVSEMAVFPNPKKGDLVVLITGLRTSTEAWRKYGESCQSFRWAEPSKAVIGVFYWSHLVIHVGCAPFGLCICHKERYVAVGLWDSDNNRAEASESILRAWSRDSRPSSSVAATPVSRTCELEQSGRRGNVGVGQSRCGPCGLTIFMVKGCIRAILLWGQALCKFPNLP